MYQRKTGTCRQIQVQEKAFEKIHASLPLEVGLVMIPLTVMGSLVLLTPHFKANEVMCDDFSLLTTTCVLQNICTWP